MSHVSGKISLRWYVHVCSLGMRNITHIQLNHVTRMNESCHRYKWVVSLMCMRDMSDCHATFMNEASYIRIWITSHTWIRHVTRLHIYTNKNKQIHGSSQGVACNEVGDHSLKHGPRKYMDGNSQVDVYTNGYTCMLYVYIHASVYLIVVRTHTYTCSRYMERYMQYIHEAIHAVYTWSDVEYKKERGRRWSCGCTLQGGSDPQDALSL